MAKSNTDVLFDLCDKLGNPFSSGFERKQRDRTLQKIWDQIKILDTQTHSQLIETLQKRPNSLIQLDLIREYLKIKIKNTQGTLLAFYISIFGLLFSLLAQVSSSTKPRPITNLFFTVGAGAGLVSLIVLLTPKAKLWLIPRIRKQWLQCLIRCIPTFIPGVVIGILWFLMVAFYQGWFTNIQKDNWIEYLVAIFALIFAIGAVYEVVFVMTRGFAHKVELLISLFAMVVAVFAIALAVVSVAVTVAGLCVFLFFLLVVLISIYFEGLWRQGLDEEILFIRAQVIAK